MRRSPFRKLKVRRIFVIAATLFAFPAQAVITIDWVVVGDPGNAGDTEVMTCCGPPFETSGYGAVADEYRISKFEITNAQYAEFLNAVAGGDELNELYKMNMGSGYGGITRSYNNGSNTYTAIAGRENMPVNFVTFWDAIRFANWMHNGQGSAGTEDGAYTIAAAGAEANSVTRNPGATVFLPSEDEWYKAAYYKGGGTNAGYWDYPTGSDTETTCTVPGATANTANCHVIHFDLADVGSYTGAASPSGTFDQAGNVWEWNEAIINGSGRGLRGGDFINYAIDLAASVRFLSIPADKNRGWGFRVASLAPASSVPSLSPLGIAILCALMGLRGYRKLHA